MEKTLSHCATCLFALHSDPSIQTTLLPTDMQPPVDQVFARSDSHRVPTSHLADSAHRGCPTCCRLLSYLEELGICERCISLEWFPSGLIGQDDPGKPLCHLSTSISAPALHDEFIAAEATEIVTLELCRPPFRTTPHLNLTTIHPSLRSGTPIPPTSTSSPTTLSLAKLWLDNCKASHQTCAASSPFNPSRLLHISPAALLLCDKPPPSTPYAALSHRWSTSTASVILTLANFSDRVTRGISIVNLPPLMRDAVHAVRALGLEWLWIDSLCIVQDSAEDWKREAGMMAGVYMGAEVTVAATGCGAEGDGGGMFTGGREGEKVQEMGGDVFVRGGVEHFRWLNGVGLVDGEDGRHWPLLRRGWVYQEQWPSRRMLHFTKREVVWVCKQGMACECGWYRLEDKREAEAVEDGGGEQEGETRMRTPRRRKRDPASGRRSLRNIRREILHGSRTDCRLLLELPQSMLLPRRPAGISVGCGIRTSRALYFGTRETGRRSPRGQGVRCQLGRGHQRPVRSNFSTLTKAPKPRFCPST